MPARERTGVLNLREILTLVEGFNSGVSGSYPTSRVFQHSGARDFDLGGGFQHSTTSFPMVKPTIVWYTCSRGSSLGYCVKVMLNPRDPFFLAIRRVPKLHAGNGLTCDEGESAR